VEMTRFEKRRRLLGMPMPALARLSGVPVDTVERILVDPTGVPFEHVSAVGRVLGLDLFNLKRVPAKKLLKKRALKNARYVARVVQGTQGLEAAAVDLVGYKRLVRVAAGVLLAGDRGKLWDE
jgi:hypothetical protein